MVDPDANVLRFDSPMEGKVPPINDDRLESHRRPPVLALVHLRPSGSVGDTGAVALEKQVITAGDANRSYLVAEPPPGPPVSAVVMNLHDTSSTADRQARLSGLEQLAHTAGAVVVFPQAIEPIRAGYEWDPSRDVDFIAGLATELLSRHRTPHGRLILTGMSGGARMSSLFASIHPELVQAVGAVAGCARRVSVAPVGPDPVVPRHERQDQPVRGQRHATMERKRPRCRAGMGAGQRHHGSTDGSRAEPHAHPNDLRCGGAARRGDAVDLTRAGHTWPGGHLGLLLSLFLGRTSREIDATKSIWEFGLRHAGDP